MKKRLASAAFVTIAVLGATAPAARGGEAPEEHCVVHVIGQKPSGEFVLTKPECHASFADAMADAGAGDRVALLDGANTAELRAYNTQSASSIIGIHYDGSNFNGSSLTVSGSDCLGGYTNLSATWDNRVSSTSNGCNRIRHWDGANKAGANEDTFGAGGNLSGMNNKATSIQYLT